MGAEIDYSWDGEDVDFEQLLKETRVRWDPETKERTAWDGEKWVPYRAYE